MSKLTFTDVYKLVVEKRQPLSGTIEEREDAFIESLPTDNPAWLSAYETAMEILRNSSEGLTINDLYKDSVRVDPETDKRPLQIQQFKKLLDKAAKKVGNIDFNIYSGTYSLSSDSIEDIQDGEVPNIEDMDDLDDEFDEEDDMPRRNTLEDEEDVKHALSDYRRSNEWGRDLGDDWAKD